MLPPILEIYVVWHPEDKAGEKIANELVAHFHGTIFSGLIGGAIEVYVRHHGWADPADAPRPIPFVADDLPSNVREPRFLAVVPLVGNELASAVEPGHGRWHEYIERIVCAQNEQSERVSIFPYLLDQHALKETALGSLISHLQFIGLPPLHEHDTIRDQFCRDLAQGIHQALSSGDKARLQVFISHTKHHSSGEEKQDVDALIKLVRDVIADTRLQEFFDASDLQPGRNWVPALIENAETSALLAIRTDLYPSREWCQREVLVAKRSGMPVIIVDALRGAEERGSYLMDHVPRVPARMYRGQWQAEDILRALNLLVDEALKRTLWVHQQAAAISESELDVAWWAPHAPEPITLSDWFLKAQQQGLLSANTNLIILHPDPPLGPEEKSVLQEIVSMSEKRITLDVMTPRLLAARKG